MEKYKYWEILKEMPEGWKIDKTSGSPLHGHEFVTNGKSPLNGQKRALLKIQIENKSNPEIQQQKNDNTEASTIRGLLNNKSIAINAEKRNADQGKLF